jgi:hypothetical protein
MKSVLIFIGFLSLSLFSFASNPDSSTANVTSSVLVIPYMPSMHLSDADNDIAEGSQMEMPQMRSTLRQGIVKALNKKFTNVYNVRGFNNDFVNDDNRDMDVLYHTLLFQGDTTYPLKYPARFAIKDTVPQKKGSVKPKPETRYMNVGIYDEMLIPDLSKKYNSDYIIFLNEIDIKTHFEDCMNLALKIYRRDLKIHYSIFDKTGKQLYGDVAVSHFGSGTNDVNEIINENFPSISDYILNSFNKVAK